MFCKGVRLYLPCLAGFLGTIFGLFLRGPLAQVRKSQFLESRYPEWKRKENKASALRPKLCSKSSGWKRVSGPIGFNLDSFGQAANVKPKLYIQRLHKFGIKSLIGNPKEKYVCLLFSLLLHLQNSHTVLASFCYLAFSNINCHVRIIYL